MIIFFFHTHNIVYHQVLFAADCNNFRPGKTINNVFKFLPRNIIFLQYTVQKKRLHIVFSFDNERFERYHSYNLRMDCYNNNTIMVGGDYNIIRYRSPIANYVRRKCNNHTHNTQYYMLVLFSFLITIFVLPITTTVVGT